MLFEALHYFEKIMEGFMISHISIGTKNFEQTRDYYDKTLAEFGYQRLWNQDTDEKQEAGYGKDGKIGFLLFTKKNSSENEQKEQVGQANGLHICFEGQDAERIQKWYEKCLELGGKDNGRPG